MITFWRLPSPLSSLPDGKAVAGLCKLWELYGLLPLSSSFPPAWWTFVPCVLKVGHGQQFAEIPSPPRSSFSTQSPVSSPLLKIIATVAPGNFCFSPHSSVRPLNFVLVPLMLYSLETPSSNHPGQSEGSSHLFSLFLWITVLCYLFSNIWKQFFHIICLGFWLFAVQQLFLQQLIVYGQKQISSYLYCFVGFFFFTVYKIQQLQFSHSVMSDSLWPHGL